MGALIVTLRHGKEFRVGQVSEAEAKLYMDDFELNGSNPDAHDAALSINYLNKSRVVFLRSDVLCYEYRATEEESA